MAAASSASFFDRKREEDRSQMIKQLPSSPTAPSESAAAPAKKKRNLPGCPKDPDAEVIALSPKTLMATNRFVCEVCNKGFQREQNLQLHRRGHNLPWKLKQKSTKEVRRKVYLCPEPTCVHHEPSRALGDLTGIKKHFCRKHGEKKWKCDKCAKRYAVQSDWKAHSKTCGTREYRCDCGTLFSRRDSFITHRAFCDALAQESERLPPTLTSLSSHLYGGSSASGGGNMGLGLSQMFHSSTSSSSAAAFYSSQDFVATDTAPSAHPLLMQLPDLHSGSNLFNLSFPQSSAHDNLGGAGAGAGAFESVYGVSSMPLPQMSATALLQKAALMGATTTTTSGGSSFRRVNEAARLEDLLMNSLAGGGSAGIGGSDGLTRDFLGVGGVMRGIVGAGQHRDVDIGSLEPKFNSASVSGGTRSEYSNLQ